MTEIALVYCNRPNLRSRWINWIQHQVIPDIHIALQCGMGYQGVPGCWIRLIHRERKFGLLQ